MNLFKSSKEPNFKFNLGDVVRDTITGFEGVIVSRTQWLYNCNTYGVKSRELKDGKPQDAVYFDEPQLELVSEKELEEDNGHGGNPPPISQTNRF